LQTNRALPRHPLARVYFGLLTQNRLWEGGPSLKALRIRRF
jgi:hypothetical protein